MISPVFLSLEDPELKKAWSLADTSDPGGWEYMGTEFIQKGLWSHCFRNQLHPITETRVYMHVATPHGWTPGTSWTYENGKAEWLTKEEKQAAKRAKKGGGS